VKYQIAGRIPAKCMAQLSYNFVLKLCAANNIILGDSSLLDCWTQKMKALGFSEM
jgi:hypothetical protein